LLGEGVEIAAVNGPTSVVVSGERASVAAVVERLGARARWLRVSHGFHSALMEPMLAEVGQALEGAGVGRPEVAWVSTVAGAAVEKVDAGYWGRQVREPVRFADAVRVMRSQGVGAVVEVGADASLSALVDGCALLRRGRGECESLLRAVSELFVAG